VVKDDREVRKLETQVFELVRSNQRQQMQLQLQLQAGAGGEGNASSSTITTTTTTSSTPSTTPSATPSSITATMEQKEKQIAQLKGELEEARHRLTRSQKDEAEVIRLEKIEDSKTAELLDWMTLYRTILWPSRPHEIEVGRPLTPGDPWGLVLDERDFHREVWKKKYQQQMMGNGNGTASSFLLSGWKRNRESELTEGCSGSSLTSSPVKNPSDSFPSPQISANDKESLQESAASSPEMSPPTCPQFHYLKSLVPDPLRRTAELAVEMGIDQVEDVINLLEYFRWMNWCSLTFHALHDPGSLTTRAWKRLLDAAKGLKFPDEKLIKVLSGILARAR